ncbi:hypothetical protein GLAREA_08263 [Glarea lozoyensis ATCC 20868]|uniref:Uncharacterized protein n=1 Tax=Glarea lozoyensis (strain ATCC 20868 / MF5171) TaxID=1116229 RepID=S3CX64_GLAL2|nr:uncharacterized protein GLAREA_08263 [Glarea lozoyensis ATCC 20868]EPE24411.1 hypothetical protein GLAREA_08263 [Glarea lozoyensis ATCC 20868]
MCPPGVDQTTRTSPKWKLLSPETQQVLPQHATSDEAYETDVWFHEDIVKASFGLKPALFDAWTLLARPVKPTSNDKKKRQHRFHEHSSGFDTLSNEIVDLIFSHILPHKTDAISLALALDSQRIWQIIFRHTNRTTLELLAPMAGKTLTIQCSWSTALPTPIQEQTELLKIVAPSGGYGRMCEARRFFWNHTTFPNPQTADMESAEWVEAVGKHLDPETGLSKYLLRELHHSKFFPKGQWMLRNLTTQEYVCSEAPLSRSAKKPLADFNTILMHRTTWATHNEDSFMTKLGLGVGKWAGCRFDIVSQDVFEAEKSTEWRDTTREVNDEVWAAREVFKGYQKTKNGKYFRGNDGVSDSILRF